MILDRLLQARSTLANPSEELYEALTGGEGPTVAGERVSPTKALSLSAYFAAIRAIAEDVAKLPFILYERQKPRGKQRLPEHPVYQLIHDQPNPEMSSMPFWETILHHAMGWGNGIAEVQRAKGGAPLAMWLLDPTTIRIFRNERSGLINYEIRYADERKTRLLEQNDVFHVHGVGYDGLTGYSIAQKARETIGAALGARKHGAALFGNASRPGGFVTYPGPVKDKKAWRKAWDEGYRGADKAHMTAVLDMGGEFKPIAIPNKDAQWIEAQQFGIEEIARWFRMPPHKLQHLLYGTFSNIEHLGIEYVQDTLTSWAKRLWQEVWRKLLRPYEQATLFAEHIFEELLRGDTLTRYQAHAVSRQWGWASANDILELENKNPLPGEQGDIYMVPANMMPAEKMLKAEEEPEPPTEPSSMPDEESESLGEQLEHLVRAHIPSLQDAFVRVLRVEQDKIRRNIKRETKDFTRWYGAFRTKHQEYTFGVFRSSIQTLALSVPGTKRSAGDDVRAALANQHARAMATRHVARITDRTRLRIADVGECASQEVKQELPNLLAFVSQVALN